MTNERTIRAQDGESGYTLLAVMFLLFLLTLSLGIAAPRMAREIQLDRERETMQRALQYRRAIQLYYRKFRAYPPTLDALVKTNEIRFLRKKYIDPITGKDDWKLIHYGQNKTQTLGFFGQPLAGGSSTVAGVGSTSGTGSLSGSSSLFDSSSTDSSSAATSTSTGSSTTTGTSTGSSFGTSTSLTSSTGSSSSGQTMGGLGIIGVSPNSAKQSIMIYKKKTHYNEWEFFYDPISDQKMTSSSLGSLSSSSSGSLTSTGSSSSTTSSGSTSSTGSTSSPSSF